MVEEFCRLKSFLFCKRYETNVLDITVFLGNKKTFATVENICYNQGAKSKLKQKG